MTGGGLARIKAVLFDLGGVVFDSPLHRIAAFEEDHGLPAGAVGQIVMGAGRNGA